MNFNWEDKKQELKTEIERLMKKHRDFINSDIGKFLSQSDYAYGDEWANVLWWNGKSIECYDCETPKKAQEIIDFYHFSLARTKVINCRTGKDITNGVVFNPLYNDTFITN